MDGESLLNKPKLAQFECMNHLNDKQQPLSSLAVTFLLQTKMLHTINVLFIELHRKVDLLLAATCPNKSPILSPPHALWLPMPTQNAICNTTAPQLTHAQPPKIQTPLSPPRHEDPCNKPALVSKFRLHKKYVPAKPPFTHGHCNLVPTCTKDQMCPPNQP